MAQKSLIIVGVGPGNGRAIAERFGREGYGLGLIARSQEKLRRHAKELTAAGFETAYHAADSRDLVALCRAITGLESELGVIDVLAFNAYGATPERPSSLAPEQLIDDLVVNAAAPLAAAQAVLPGMRKRKTGAIVFTGGGLALYPSMQAPSLSIGKAAIRSLAFVLNEELKPAGVRAGTVTVAGLVGPDIPASTVADAFWSLAQDRTGEMPAEIVLKP
ncbi:MAG: SDR family NAD(P)-dependent oxidoreductase [Myxococcota bacterium]